jgi:hypothetical protein
MYDIMKTRQNSWFLNFIWILYNFFTFLPHVLHHDTRTKCKKIWLHFMYIVLEMSHEHEYHFSNKCTPWFYAPAIHIGRITKKYIERSEIVKYSKQRKNGANFEHVHCMSVCWVSKKFELKNVKFFKTSPWLCRIHSPKREGSRRMWHLHREFFFAESHGPRALGEFDGLGAAVTAWMRRRHLCSSPRDMVPELSVKETCTVGQPFAESWA